MEPTTLELSIFGAGCGIGLFVALLVWIGNIRLRSSMRKEVEDLKKHLHTNMSIHAKGYEEMKQEIEKLKKENENLRITVATLSNKPGRAELKMLHTWERAVKLLTLKSPTFAPAWEMAIAEAKRELDDTDSGVKALARKVFSLLPQDSQYDGTD
jgi:predicted  nucleic acid-binding Zn-ribbon protein